MVGGVTDLLVKDQCDCHSIQGGRAGFSYLTRACFACEAMVEASVVVSVER